MSITLSYLLLGIPYLLLLCVHAFIQSHRLNDLSRQVLTGYAEMSP